MSYNIFHHPIIKKPQSSRTWRLSLCQKWQLYRIKNYSLNPEASAASQSPTRHPIPLVFFCLICIGGWWELEGWVLRRRALLFHLWAYVFGSKLRWKILGKPGSQHEPHHRLQQEIHLGFPTKRWDKRRDLALTLKMSHRSSQIHRKVDQRSAIVSTLGADVLNCSQD